MSSNRLVFDGMDELKAALRALPAELTTEAGRIVEATANGAAAALRTAYGAHRVTGALQDRVYVARRDSSRFGVRFEIVNAAKHAWLFDNGTQARHWVTGKSTGAMWGKTPPTHVFVKTLQAARRRMDDEHAALLVRAGLSVTRG